jgi:hypothetical protein
MGYWVNIVKFLACIGVFNFSFSLQSVLVVGQ